MRSLLLLFLITFVACSADHYETKAKILERKMLQDDQLLILYSFKAGDRTIVDSVRTENKVIPHDSLRVIYSASDPEKNTLKFE
jgi:hypothetical protein